MPRMDFKDENRVQDQEGFPKLKFVVGERARIVVMERPEVQFVHRLETPTLVNGKPIYDTKTRKDNTEYNKMRMDFLGNPICIGDFGTLQDKGIDPKNCPACDKSRHGSQVNAPKRRFAMNVVRYVTKPGGFNLADTYGVNVIVWAFTDQIFDKLTDFAREWKPLHAHDLLLGPCTEVQFQRYDINIAKDAVWLMNDQLKDYTQRVFQGNQCPDLSSFCGQKVERAWMVEALGRIQERWDQVNKAASATPQSADPFAAPMGQAGLGGDLEDLLSQQADGPTAVPALPDDLLGGASPAPPVPDLPVPASDPLSEFTPGGSVQAGPDGVPGVPLPVMPGAPAVPVPPAPPVPGDGAGDNGAHSPASGTSEFPVPPGPPPVASPPAGDGPKDEKVTVNFEDLLG